MPETDIHRNDRFAVRIGRQRLRCRAVEGLASTPDDDGNPNIVVLVRPVTSDRSLFDWWQASSRRAARRSVQIDLLDSGGKSVVSWVLAGALPHRWVGPHLDSLDAGPAMERLELTYEQLTWTAR